MEKLNLDKNNLKKFGITMGMAFLIITLFILLKTKHLALSTSIVSIVFFSLAITLPNLLKPIFILWMKLAFVLAWINTRLILFFLFYVVFMPIGIGMRLFGVDLLERRIEKNKDTYWIKKEKKEFSHFDYEKQF